MGNLEDNTCRGNDRQLMLYFLFLFLFLFESVFLFEFFLNF